MAPKGTNLFVSSLLLLGLSITSFARIGETMHEAVKRYGEVVRRETIQGREFYSFEKNGFHRNEWMSKNLESRCLSSSLSC
jgi:hypothetical protein